MIAWLEHGDPDGEVAIAYLAKELLREVAEADWFLWGRFGPTSTPGRHRCRGG